MQLQCLVLITLLLSSQLIQAQTTNNLLPLALGGLFLGGLLGGNGLFGFGGNRGMHHPGIQYYPVFLGGGGGGGEGGHPYWG